MQSTFLKELEELRLNKGESKDRVLFLMGARKGDKSANSRQWEAEPQKNTEERHVPEIV